MISQSQPPLPPWETLPTMYDLPSENLEESNVAQQEAEAANRRAARLARALEALGVDIDELEAESMDN